MNATMSLPPVLLTARELARLAGCSPSTIAAHRASGKITPAALTATGSILYRTETLSSLIKKA